MVTEAPLDSFEAPLDSFPVIGVPALIWAHLQSRRGVLTLSQTGGKCADGRLPSVPLRPSALNQFPSVGEPAAFRRTLE